ncbi:MAG: hypothetical protein KKF77_10370 [Proteobacteria bacterium]|nr:hypothetical protein [Pseudomonadota bacterium]
MSFSVIFDVQDALIRELSRAITGRLFSDDQIRSITKGTIGRLVSDYFPSSCDDKAAHDRVEEAKDHLNAANVILSSMQTELSTQVEKLNQVISDIDEKKKIAERYDAIAATNKDQVEAYKAELGEIIRAEIEIQSNKDRGLRRAVSVAVWVITLVAGATLGTYFKEIVVWVKSLMLA